MMRSYRNKTEISRDLKILRLKRDISIEELKLVKSHFKEDLSFSSWIQTGIKYAGKIGFYKLMRKLIK